MNHLPRFLLIAITALLVACSSPDSSPPGGSTTASTSSASSSSTAGSGGAASTTGASTATSSSSSASGGAGGQGAGGHPEWAPNCVGASSAGDPATGCDDGNPCTVDSVVNGACVHMVEGAGFQCSSDGAMQCDVGECCPVAPGECAAEGVRDACADGSICFEAKCWIDCSKGAAACPNEFPTCAPKSVGSVSVAVCE